MPGNQQQLSRSYPFACCRSDSLLLFWAVIATVSPVVSVGVLLLNLSILTSYLFNAQRYDWPFILGNITSSLLLFFSFYLVTTRIELVFRKYPDR
jgi:hypothetical protein